MINPRNILLGLFLIFLSRFISPKAVLGVLKTLGGTFICLCASVIGTV